ncbi:MAG TPA: putative molybdenum carrier protein, partial [Chthoniobacterales bacterium]|nr:putative molybdenum carrier protein [Chthoniobacterales bacterium]
FTVWAGPILTATSQFHRRTDRRTNTASAAFFAPAREAKLTVKLPRMKPIKIVSGGQTGADRAALDWALTHGVECGGWCPKGRKAEDGPIDRKYPLKETPSAAYLQRTEQ